MTTKTTVNDLVIQLLMIMLVVAMWCTIVSMGL